jgi:hypothetical protein
MATAACSTLEVRPEAPRLPPAAIERDARAVGIHFSDGFRSAQPTHEISLGRGGDVLTYRHLLGDAAVATLRDALGAVHATVVDAAPPPTRVEAITPQALEVVVPEAPTIWGHLDQNAVVASYVQGMEIPFRIHVPGGRMEQFTAIGKVSTGIYGPLFTSQGVLDRQLLRNVAAAFIVALHERRPNATAAPVPAHETTLRAVGVVAVRVDAGLARDDGIERRINACLADAVPPPASLAVEQPAAALRDTVFPWLEPGIAPRTDDGVKAMLSRPLVRTRLGGLGIGTLVLYTVRETPRETTPNMVCVGGFGAGACFGLYEERIGYGIELALWDVAIGEPIGTRRADVERRTGAIGLGLPIPYVSSTAAEACARMKEFVRTAIDRKP